MNYEYSFVCIGLVYFSGYVYLSAFDFDGFMLLIFINWIPPSVPPFIELNFALMKYPQELLSVIVMLYAKTFDWTENGRKIQKSGIPFIGILWWYEIKAMNWSNRKMSNKVIMKFLISLGNYFFLIYNQIPSTSEVKGQLLCLSLTSLPPYDPI